MQTTSVVGNVSPPSSEQRPANIVIDCTNFAPLRQTGGRDERRVESALHLVTILYALQLRTAKFDQRDVVLIR